MSSIDYKDNPITEVYEITEGDRVFIEELAVSLSVEEIIAYFYRTPDELTDLEMRIVVRAHARGRIKGVKKAGEALFGQFKGKGSDVISASLSYMMRHGGDWKGLDTAKSVHKFVVVDETDKELMPSTLVQIK